jgi:hypothetical protein
VFADIGVSLINAYLLQNKKTWDAIPTFSYSGVGAGAAIFIKEISGRKPEVGQLQYRAGLVVGLILVNLQVKQENLSSVI